MKARAATIVVAVLVSVAVLVQTGLAGSDAAHATRLPELPAHVASQSQADAAPAPQPQPGFAPR